MVAVEANPHHYTVATRNVSINNASIDLIHAAVAAEDGTIGFSIDNRVFSGDRRQPSIDVPALSINRLVEDHGIPSLIIMDIEGYEWVALSGASRTLQSPSTDWCIEVHINAGLEEFAGSLESILKLITRASYTLLMARVFGQLCSPTSRLSRKFCHLIWQY
jgi:FkbM family methyltransferase